MRFERSRREISARCADCRVARAAGIHWRGSSRALGRKPDDGVVHHEELRGLLLVQLWIPRAPDRCGAAVGTDATAALAARRVHISWLPTQPRLCVALAPAPLPSPALLLAVLAQVAELAIHAVAAKASAGEGARLADPPTVQGGAPRRQLGVEEPRFDTSAGGAGSFRPRRRVVRAHGEAALGARRRVAAAADAGSRIARRLTLRTAEPRDARHVGGVWGELRLRGGLLGEGLLDSPAANERGGRPGRVDALQSLPQRLRPRVDPA
mmetsp:Transcript_42623/g.123170  ORF Transcript_42623/g.123170 Transcript_42623/m.123170 type:complete len:267 (+) Transcript_42623:142-942(+)